LVRLEVSVQYRVLSFTLSASLRTLPIDPNARLQGGDRPFSMQAWTNPNEIPKRKSEPLFIAISWKSFQWDVFRHTKLSLSFDELQFSYGAYLEEGK
jgi:hypothetical protein